MTDQAPVLLVVDAANVIGSRPDGWWRDRGAAAYRLLDDLRAGAARDDGVAADVVLVLEGAARAAVEPGRHGRVRVVHAPGSGDDEIVAQVAAATEGSPRQSIVVVTADRGLRARVHEAGADTHGPRWLWRRLERAP